MAKNGKTPKSKSIDSDRETRVLLEDMNRSITRIAEAQSSTSAQIAEIKATMATKSEVNTISMAVMQISSDLKSLTNKVDENLTNHDKRITKLEEKVLV